MEQIGSNIEYHKGFLYLFGGNSKANELDSLYRYHLENQLWEKLELESAYTPRYLACSCIFEGYAYLFYGWSNQISNDRIEIFKLDLEKLERWEEIPTLHEEEEVHLIRRDSYGCGLARNKVYMFGGYRNAGITNSLAGIDLLETPLKPKLFYRNYLAPKGRIHHCLVTINKSIYMFGGEDSGVKFNDLWKYDLDTQNWELVLGFGSIPEARSRHACDSEGDIIIVWGGRGEFGELNDLHKYNSLAKVWTKIEKANEESPTSRSGACIAVSLPFLFVFGGYSSSGYLNDLWLFEAGVNTYTKLETIDSIEPSGVYKPVCEVQKIRNNLKFTVMFGTGKDLVPSGQVYEYDYTEMKWTALFDPSYNLTINRANAVVKKIENHVLVIGGEIWGYEPKNTVFSVNLATKTVTYYQDLDFSLISSGFAYQGTELYIHGGLSLQGKIIRETKSTNEFYKFNLKSLCSQECPWKCSKGTYGSECLSCPEGTYSDSYGATVCSNCLKGTSNPEVGTTSLRQCYPCEVGFYSNQEGLSRCLTCPNGMYCPVGSINPTFEDIKLELYSSQPQLYESSSGNLNLIVSIAQICIFLLILTALVAIKISKKLSKTISKLDLFKEYHNYVVNEPMKLKQTFIGGIFSLVFILVAVFMIFIAVLIYSEDNIQENKALVPLVTIEEEAEGFYAEFVLEIKLMRYGGECFVGENQCSSLTLIEIIDIEFQEMFSTCILDSDTGDCSVVVYLTQASFSESSSIKLETKDRSSFASGIQVNSTAYSSIPGEYSSITASISPPASKVFIGSTPTEFFYSMTPSLFRSQVSNWPEKETGYHVSVLNPPQRGSSSFVYDISSNGNLKVFVQLKKRDTSLVTNRVPKQTFMILVSSLLGSVFGVMGIVKASMRFFEGKKSAVSIMISNRKHRKKVFKNHEKYQVIFENSDFGISSTTRHNSA